VFVGTPVWLTSLLKWAFPYRRQLARLSRIPFVAAALHKTLFNGDDMIFLPKDRVAVGQTVEQPGSTVVPSALVDAFIEQAGQRWIMDFCICREGDDCQDYPHDLGSIFLGEAVAKINPKLGHLASREETLAHAHRATELGLVHLIGRDRLDSLWTGAVPFGRMLTICHCCPCCCLFRVLPDLDPVNRAKVTRMPGVNVWVEAEECLGCGNCAEAGCFVNAIELVGGCAQISAECRGCGRCVETYPNGAIHLTIEDSDYLQKQIARISGLVDVL
jgi:NAD-dependent dihydropyrimidine dehydrogenase PreA subunit